MDADHSLGTCKHGILYLRGCDKCEQEVEKPVYKKPCPYVFETCELNFSEVENFGQAPDNDKRRFDRWWEIYKTCYPEWQYADREALLFQAYLAGLDDGNGVPVEEILANIAATTDDA